jgi:hypothetical protein
MKPFQETLSGSNMSTTSTSDSEDSQETYASLGEHLRTLAAVLEEYDGMAADIQSHITSMEQPVTAVALASFTQPLHLKEAPFRFQRFQIRKEAQDLFALEETASFRTICKHIRDCLFREGCVQKDGSVVLPPALSAFYDVSGPVSYLSLLSLEKIVV